MGKVIFTVLVILSALYAIFIIYKLNLFGADINKDMEIAKHNLRVDLGMKEWSVLELLNSWRLAVALILLIAMFAR